MTEMKSTSEIVQLYRLDTYFVRDHSDAPQKYSDADVIKMLEYLTDNIFVEFGGRIFQQTIGIPMGTNCAPLLADLFLYSYEAEFVKSLLQAGKKHLAQQINFTYKYIDDVLSLKNTKFAEYLKFIYPCELEIKETTETAASSSYLDCYLYIDNGKLTTRLYDKRDDFNFPIVNFPFLSSNIPSAPVYGVCVSQLIRYARTCSNYQDFKERGKVLTTKLLSQGYQKTKLVATLKKFYGRHHDLVNPYNVAVSGIVSDVFASDAPNPGHTLLPIFPSFRPMGMVGEACLPNNAYYPRTPDYTLCSGVHVCWSEHSDSTFVYGFMGLDYGFGTMTATTWTNTITGSRQSKWYLRV